MKRLLFFTFLLFVLDIYLEGQSLEFGLRDNLYAHADYKGKAGWMAGYEQSLLNTAIKEQSGRVFAGYVYDKDKLTIDGIAYYGTEYSGAWQAYGIFAECVYKLNRLSVDAILNPHYDTGLDFNLCYRAELGVRLWQIQNKCEEVELCASYGNIPEYRMAVNNFRMGFIITSGNLWIKPMVCIPQSDNSSGQKYVRIICSFGWHI